MPPAPPTPRPGEESRASILHADLDAFYASVERRDDPRLHRRPVLVGAGVVLAASYEAKRCGVRTAMGVAAARRLCPYAVVVPPRISAYVEASRGVFAVFERTAPLVEGLSIDEAFLDVRGLERISGPPVQIARRLREEVRREVGLPLTVGIARTKFLAKVASGVAKPDGLLLVEPEREREFLHPLPVERLWGVGPATARRLHAAGLRTVADVAAREPEELMRLTGRAAGRMLHTLAAGRDPRPVRPGRRRRSIGSQRALGRRPLPPDELAAILAGIVERVARRLRMAQRASRTVVLRLRFADFTRATRSRTLAEPTSRTHVILAAAGRLLRDALPLIRRRGITLLGVTLAGLVVDRGAQLVLPLDRRRELDRAVDGVRERFGAGAITRGALVGQERGLEVPQWEAEM